MAKPKRDLPMMPSTAVDDPNRLRCEWVSEGRRCRFPGGISPHTNGTGPWYCRFHFNCADPKYGAEVVEQSIQGVPYLQEAA